MINKLINLILIFLIISCSSSKNIQKIESVKYKLPKNAIKIENASLDKNNKKDQHLMSLQNIYKIDNIYVGFGKPFNGEVKRDILQDNKNGFDSDYKKFGFIESRQYKSSIEKINNNNVFIMYRYYDNIGQYSFKILKNDYHQIIGGTIVFEKQSDFSQATKILYNLLNSIKFE